VITSKTASLALACKFTCYNKMMSNASGLFKLKVKDNKNDEGKEQGTNEITQRDQRKSYYHHHHFFSFF
jgi:hypothetical protein